MVWAQALLSLWISYFGVTSVITTDRGAQFTSSVWSEIYSILGIRRSQTPSYHPQSNGLIERFHHYLKTSLWALLAGPNWICHLPLVLHGLHSVHKDDNGYLLLTLLGDFLDVAQFPTKVFLQSFQKALAPSLSQLYRGPYRVLKRSDKLFVLQIGDKKDSVSVDRLRPFFSTNPVVPAVPPTHGTLVIIRLLGLQLQLDQTSLHLLQLLFLQMTCNSCNKETIEGLWEIIHNLLFLLADVWWESCGAPVGFLECSTQHTPYFICYCFDYCILHLV